MTEEQADDLIGLMNDMWRRQAIPHPSRTWDILAAKLTGADHGVAKRAILKLYDTAKWMPSWSEIRELVEPDDDSPTAALADAQSKLLPYGVNGVLDKLPVRTAAVVRRMGVGVLNSFERPPTDWNLKRWMISWDEIAEDIAAGKELGPQKSILEIVGQHQTEQLALEEDAGAQHRTNERLRDMIGRLGGGPAELPKD